MSLNSATRQAGDRHADIAICTTPIEVYGAPDNRIVQRKRNR